MYIFHFTSKKFQFFGEHDERSPELVCMVLTYVDVHVCVIHCVCTLSVCIHVINLVHAEWRQEIAVT